MNRQEWRQTLIAGLLMLIVASGCNILFNFYPSNALWNLMFVTGLGAVCFLGIWAVAFVFHTGQEIADWIECRISDSVFWHAVILIGSCFLFVWLFITAKGELFSMLTDSAGLTKATIFASSIAGMTLIAGIIIEFVLISHYKHVGTDDIDDIDLGNVVNVDFANPRR